VLSKFGVFLLTDEYFIVLIEYNMNILRVYFMTLMLCMSASAEIFYVNSNATAGGDGSSWETAFNYLQDALDSTNSETGDQVWIAKGTYYPDDGNNVTEGDRLATFFVKDGVQLYGGFSGVEDSVDQRNWGENKTYLSGEIYNEKIFWSLNIITVEPDYDASAESSITLDGLYIIKGNANGDGVSSEGAPLNVAAAIGGGGIINVKNCYFADHSSAISHGGVIAHSTVLATNCTFENNSSGVASYCSMVVSDCLFINNSTSAYGGVANGGYWRVENSEFIGNYTSSTTNSIQFGGGVALGGTWIVENCKFSDNYSKQGGVFSGGYYGGNVTAIDSVFENNRAVRTVGYNSSHGGVSQNCDFTAINCIFDNNSSTDAAGVANGRNFTAINCVFVNNSASRGGVFASSTLELVNSTLALNGNDNSTSGIASAVSGNIFNSIIYNNLGTTLFDACNLKNTTDTIPLPNGNFSYNIIEGGINAFNSIDPQSSYYFNESFILDSDPLFFDINDPDGLDETWGTEDDGLRLNSNSPAISKGSDEYLPNDTYDLNLNDITDEVIPIDLANFYRVQEVTLDLGAYEFGQQNGLISFFTVSVSTEVGGTVNQDASTVYYQPVNLSLLATPLEGYVFSRWIGNIEASVEDDNPLTLTATNDFSITASFTPDLSDLDFDGLTLYDEKVTYNTNPNIDDTSGDGLKDGVVVSAGFDPTVDYSNLVNASRQGMADLRPGSTIIEVSGNQAAVQLQMEESSDLQTWEDAGDPATVTVPADTDTKFFRFKMAD
jgi:hypothetical protein